MKLLITPTFGVVRHFIFCQGEGCEMASPCLNWYFPHSHEAEHHPICFCSFQFLLYWLPVRVFHPFSYRVVIIFLADLEDVFIYSGSQSFTSEMHCRYLTPVSSLSENIFMGKLGYLSCKVWMVQWNSQIHEIMYTQAPAPVPGTV